MQQLLGSKPASSNHLQERVTKSHTEDKPKGKQKTEEGGQSTEQMLPFLSVFGACGSNMKMHYKFGSLQNASKCKLLIEL